MGIKRVLRKHNAGTARSTKALLNSNRNKLNADAEVDESPISVIEATIAKLGADSEKIKCDETAIYLLLDDNKQAIITPDTEESGTYEIQTKDDDTIHTDSAGNYTNLDELREAVGIEVKVDEPVAAKQENKKVLRAGENYKAALEKKKEKPEKKSEETETVEEDSWEEVEASASRKTAKLNASYEDLNDEELQDFVDELQDLQRQLSEITVDNTDDVEDFIDDVYMICDACTDGYLVDEMDSIIDDWAESLRVDPESAEDLAEDMLSDLDDAIQNVLDDCYSEQEKRGEEWEDLDSSRTMPTPRRRTPMLASRRKPVSIPRRKPMNASRKHKPMSKLQPQFTTKNSSKLNANRAKTPLSLRAGTTYEACSESNAIAKAILDATGTAQSVQGCLFNMPDPLNGNPSLYLIYEDTEDKLFVVTPVDVANSGATFATLDEAVAKIANPAADAVTEVAPIALPGDIIDVLDYEEVLE